MASTRGRLDAQGCPLVTVAIFPEGEPTSAKDVEALIDTGFRGFAQIPMKASTAIPLKVIGTFELTHSDGITEPVPAAWATVRLGTQTHEGFVLLSQRSEEALLGIHFLEVFAKALIYSVREQIVILADRIPTDVD